jgi:uncharacterized protein (TIRG00374 family)
LSEPSKTIHAAPGAVPDALPAGADVVIKPAPPVPKVRRAADVLRLIVSVAVLVVVLLVAALADVRVRTAELGVLDIAAALPWTLRDAFIAAMQVIALAVPAGIVVVMAVRRRFALVAMLLITAAAATGAGELVSHLVLGHSHPATWSRLLDGRGGVFNATFPPVALLAGTAGTLTVAGPELPRRWRVGLWWLVGIGIAVDVVVGGYLLIDATAAVAVGVTVGSVVLLSRGAPATRPTATEVVAALQECGVALKALEQLPQQTSGPAMFRAAMPDGTALLVRVFADDDRDRDLLTRLSRWLLLRNPEDDRGHSTVEAAAEHEMLAMVAAARAGAGIPEAVVAYPVETRHGRRGALVAFVDVGGRRLDLLDGDGVGDDTLADLWRSVAILRQHRLAHRQLRTDNVLVDDGRHAWLIGLDQAELGASDRQLASDVAELLASLAVEVGVDRTVTSAVAGLGAPTVASAAAYLQALPLTGTTRAKVRAHNLQELARQTRGPQRQRLRPGSRPDLLAELRTGVAQATNTPPVRLEPLSRITWKRMLALLAAFVVIHLVLPQLANAGAAVRALQNADWWWVLAALPAIFVMETFSTLLQQGAIPGQLPFGPTYVVQLGGSFLNRVTPGNVGSKALNFRYLQQAGVDPGAATGSVGLQALVGLAANLVLLAVFFALTGRSTTVHVSVHGHQGLFLLIAAVMALGALFLLTPRGRRFLHDKVWAFLRSAGGVIAEVAKSPQHVGLVVVGAFGGPMVQIVALAMCVHAVGGKLPFVQIGAVYMGARVLASAAPVPGGLGALEAALIAGLSSLGMPAGAAASAVLIFRLLTYWMTIPVGWVALKIAQRRGYV